MKFNIHFGKNIKGSHGMWKERAGKVTWKCVKMKFDGLYTSDSQLVSWGMCVISAPTNMVLDFAHWVLATTENSRYLSDVWQTEPPAMK